MLGGRALGIAASALIWALPSPVLPSPSPAGPEGPPRPYGSQPAPGRAPAATDASLARSQTRAMLSGPFPRGGVARGISEGALLLDRDAPVRETVLGMIRASGASVVRIPVDWRASVVAEPPAGFQPRDPAEPEYDFAATDAAVLGAVARGLTPVLVVFDAPRFAEAPDRWPFAYPGSWDPSPLALEAFAAALSRRYDGSFPDPGDAGAVLPEVTLLQAWNEPNLARYLEPQWVARNGRWSAFSPGAYREMLNGFYRGVMSAAPLDTVIAAGVAPDGDRAGVGRMAPVTFLQGLMCLSAGAHGSWRRAGACRSPAHLDVLDFHPLSVGDPDLAARSSLDVSISDAAKVTRLLHAAERFGTVLPRAPKPLWVTELNWQSAPQSPGGVAPRLQAAWISRALHRLWVAGVSLVAWQFLIDPSPGVMLATPTGGDVEVARPAGLYSAAGVDDAAGARPKPFLRGFMLPFDPLRVSSAAVRVWALLAAPGERADLQRRPSGGRWRTIARLRADPSAVLNVLVALRGDARLRLIAGSLTSAPASPATLGG